MLKVWVSIMRLVRSSNTTSEIVRRSRPIPDSRFDGWKKDGPKFQNWAGLANNSKEMSDFQRGGIADIQSLRRAVPVGG
jgi:hypothetical protein